MKKVWILTVLLAIVPAFSFSQTAYTVRNVAGWIEAVNGIRNGGNDHEYTITVTGTVSVPASADSTFGSVTGITVIIEGNGTLSPSANGSLLVIGKDQTVVAKDVTLKGRDANNASVVNIASEGIFRMEGKAKVSDNKTSGGGSGVYVGEGKSYRDEGDWEQKYLRGGTFTMQDSASVSGNTSSSGSGGGVYVGERGSFTMEGGTISGNTSNSNGGGVYVGGTFTMRDNASLSGNAAPNRRGGGIYVSGTFTLQDNAKVTGNKDNGVYNEGTFIMKGGTISNNTGGGVVNTGTFTIEIGTISGNATNGSGGGVYNQGTFTMKDGIISGNTSSYGGGVFVPDGQYSGTFTMEGGTISGNTANIFGGGVYMGGNFTMQGNAAVSGNKTDCHGGGVYIIGYGYGDRPFTMKDSASVSGNTASGNGGGLYIAGGRGGAAILDQSSGGIIVIQDNALISGNTAIGNGGGIYFNGKSFTKTGGIIYGDDVDQKLKNNVIGGRGNAVYETKNGGWRNTTAGLTMNSDSYGFWLNEGEAIAVKFPSGFAGVWKRNNFNNILTFTENTVKSSSSNYVWVLTRISGDTYTMKRSDTASTITIKITHSPSWRGSSGTRYPAKLSVSGDSGSGQDNWNGSWEQQ